MVDMALRCRDHGRGLTTVSAGGWGDPRPQIHQALENEPSRGERTEGKDLVASSGPRAACHPPVSLGSQPGHTRKTGSYLPHHPAAVEKKNTELSEEDCPLLPSGGGGNVTLASAQKPPRAGRAAGFLGRRQAKFSRCLSLPLPGIVDHLSLHCPPSTLLIALALERRASRWLHSRWGRAGHPYDALNWIEVGVGEAGG